MQIHVLRRFPESGVSFEDNEASVTHAIWRNVVGNTKTEASRKPLARHPFVMEELKKWTSITLYRSEDDYLIPSIVKNGAQPLQPDMILRRHIRPAHKRIGVTKRIGWHSFRHGLATMLRQKKVDVKTAQEMMRHANSRIMIDFYQQAVSEEKRDAQELAMQGLLGEGANSVPFSTLKSSRKEEVIHISS
jgi:integrase